MADALERITNLVALLMETRAPLTQQQIVDELEGQYPTGDAAQRGAFERDKALLREIGVPLESEVLGGNDAGRTAYRIDRDRYELADLQLAPDEQAALQLAVAAARLADAQFGLLKLGGDRSSAPVVVANIPELPALPALREASAARAAVSFGYHGSPRRLHPYALLLRERFWYVIGHDVARGEVRTYRVDRMEGELAVGEAGAFERPADFDPRATFPTDPKLLGDEPAARAEVLVDEPRAAAIERELGAAAVVRRLPDGAVVVEVPCTNLDAFRSWLFGLGEHAEVLGPAGVRSAVVEWLQAMAGAR
ncbi:MAG TPA: WYL domain-containing protein [Ilumatobacteraceae bacterium]|nr:WYL domain-containing protein [Ilumatobacteraceae bacterium]